MLTHLHIRMKPLKHSILSIIPARAGSKRLPHKNIRSFNGLPLIQWTITEALKSNFISEVFVSTDCEVTAELSSSVGATVPYLRPDNLSTDEAKSIDVVIDVLNYYESIGKTFDFVMLLQPTSPLRTAEDIDNSIQMIDDKKADSIVSICKCEHSPLWAGKLPSNSSMKGFLNNSATSKRSQDLEDFYRLNGAIYLVRVKVLEKEKSFITKENSYGYLMSQHSSIDIDEDLDFVVAESIQNYLNRKK